MKKAFLILGILLSPVILVAQSHGITFATGMSWNQIFKKAKMETKFVFVDVYATWCIPCKVMEQSVYNEPAAGELLNDNFISIKLQTDSTGTDDPSIKAAYKDALMVNQKYQIDALPTYLIFDSSGELIYRNSGLQNLNEFITTIKANSATANSYLSQLQEYRQGRSNLINLINLYFTSVKLKNKAFSDTLTRVIKIKYIDTLPLKDILNETSLNFLGENPQLVSSHDSIFKISLTDPQVVNDARYNGKPNGRQWAEWLTTRVIGKEEVIDKLADKDGPEINWERWAKLIQSKYKGIDGRKMVIDELTAYYGSRRQWRSFAKWTTLSIHEYPPSSEGAEPFFKLNMPAWTIFLECNDKKILNEALSWSELSIKLKPKLEDQIQFLDTRANLLYKIGRNKEAITQEKAALEGERLLAERRGQPFDEIKSTYFKLLNKMRRGEPTWPIKKQ
jgi:thioredoxin-related protein